ncbi:MAG TPA: rhamnulokinase family protein [Bacteroidales bacterium]|nr:rhamnulokinase family protein [Bacteroidales bacterium]
MRHYISIDLGADSGRLILGSLNREQLILKEIHRFPNSMVQVGNKFHWDILHLYREIIAGLQQCVKKEEIVPVSIGIDTWGVDYGLLASDDTLMGMPFTYRDPRTVHAMEELTEKMPAAELYRHTGISPASYTTLCQLYAAGKSHPEILQAASSLLFIPDLLTFFLTGEKKTELCFASTSQLFNPIRNEWDEELFELIGVRRGLMQEVVRPGTTIGNLGQVACDLTGMPPVPVVAVATHDTNSAVSAIPARGGDWAFISSGTWSLMGYESPIPVISQQSFAMKFSNESGLGGNWHILKNHTGLWLLQECRRSWKNAGYSWDRLIGMALEAKPHSGFIDVDHTRFLHPGHMPSAIMEYLEHTGQRRPKDRGTLIRIILESLAMKYRYTLQHIEQLRGKPVNEIYITGGGVRNELLCQLTASATGKTVSAALAEGTATGNILCQAMADGQLKTLDEARMLVRRNCPVNNYYPENTGQWDDAFMRYTGIVSGQHRHE